MILHHALENARDDRRVSIGMVSLAQRDGIAQSRISDLKAFPHCHSTDWLLGLHFETVRRSSSHLLQPCGCSSQWWRTGSDFHRCQVGTCVSVLMWESLGILDIDPVISVLEILTCSDLEDRVGCRLAWQLRHEVTVSYQRTNSNTISQILNLAKVYSVKGIFAQEMYLQNWGSQGWK